MENQIKILLFEDDKDWETGLIKAFTKEGHKILACSNKREGGVAFVKKHNPDLIFIDIALEDGIEAGFGLAEDLASLEIPFFYLSVSAGDDQYYARSQNPQTMSLGLEPKTTLVEHYKASGNIARMMDTFRRKKLTLKIQLGNHSVFKHQILYIEYQSIERGGSKGVINAYCMQEAKAITFLGKLNDYEKKTPFLVNAGRNLLVNVEHISTKAEIGRGALKLYFRTKEDKAGVQTSIEGGKRVTAKWNEIHKTS